MSHSNPKNLALHSAVEYKIIRKIEVLLPKFDINLKNEKGYTPFLLACEGNDNEIIEMVLTRKDIDIQSATKDGFTALHILAYKGNLEAMVKVLELFPDANINAVSNKGNTPLIEACRMNRVPVVQHLLEKGADVQICNYVKKYTALHYAASSSFVECAELLVRYGADINAQNSYGFTPLVKASSWDDIAMCKFLLQKGADVNMGSTNRNALIYSCTTDNVPLFQMLVSYGADVHYPGPYSEALFYSIRKGSVQCVKELIKAGVDITAKKNGATALDVAIEENRREIVEILRECL